MENQHRQITGYRELDEREIELVNLVKALGGNIEQLVEQLTSDSDGIGIDQRWVSIGRTHLQEGLMALARAVARPTSF